MTTIYSPAPAATTTIRSSGCHGQHDKTDKVTATSDRTSSTITSSMASLSIAKSQKNNPTADDAGAVVVVDDKTSSCSSSKSSSSITSVTFGEVSVRKYNMTLGVNPSCSMGAPVCLDWDYTQQSPISVDEFESSKTFGGQNGTRRKRTTLKQMYLSYYKRKDILEAAGYSSDKFDEQERLVRKDRLKRKLSLYENYPLILGRRTRTSVSRLKNKAFIIRYKMKQSKLKKMKQEQEKQQN